MNAATNSPGQRAAWLVLFALTAMLGLYLRSAGAFRGLDADYVFHPDEPKQIRMLEYYLKGEPLALTGSLFYDGYPYGLNRVDAWILRPARFLQKTFVETLHGAPNTPAADSAWPTLYLWARGLRIFYGLLILLLAGVLARRWLHSPGAAWLTLLFLATAPLSICVTHFATGDIGADLFTLLALLSLCLYARRGRLGPLAAAGFAVGLAFGCKYNGMLAGIAVGLYLLLELLAQRRGFVFMRRSLTAAVACAAGFLVTTPALLANFKQARRDIAGNFAFIKNYDVGSELAGKPFYAKAWIGLTENTAAILGALGWVTAILALYGLIHAVRRYGSRPPPGPTGEAPTQELRFTVALTAFPFLALLVSLAGKLNVQPFHFSFLQAPLILAAVYGLLSMWRGTWKGHRLAALAAGLLALAELGRHAERECFFWSREDTVGLARTWPEMLFAPEPSAPAAPVCNLWLEPSKLSVFRNRIHAVAGPSGAFWNRVQSAPVPTIPYPVAHEWVFLNGPTFPRNLRMIVAQAGRTCRRSLVLHREPSIVTLGLRSAAFPVQADLDVGGDTQAVTLSPHEQRVLTFSPRRWRHINDTDSGRASSIIPLTARPRIGDLVVTILDTSLDADIFAVFGATATNSVDILPKDIPAGELAAQLELARYVEDLECRRRLDASTPAGAELVLPADGMYLAAGRYTMRLRVTGLAPASALSLLLEDFPSGIFTVTNAAETLAIGPGIQEVSYRFSKAFAPYRCQLRVTCTRGSCEINDWQIRPDVEGISADLAAWKHSGIRPSWMQRHPTQAPWSGEPGPAGALFDDAIQLRNIEYASSIRQGEPLTVRFDVALLDFSYRHYERAAFFFHLLDPNGNQVASCNLPVSQAIMASAGEIAVPLTDDVPALVPGSYELRLGVWHVLSRKRLPLSGDHLTRDQKRKNRLLVGPLTVHAAQN